MYETLKLLQPLINKETNDWTLEYCAYMYQREHASNILALAYSKIYKLATVVKNNYWGLTEEDYASFCLERLDFCLKTYDADAKAKFTTYFCRVYGNKLREETEKLNYKKRKCILESINEVIDMGVEDTHNLLEMMLPNTLTPREYELCKLESMGYDKAFCAEQLGVSRMTICNMEKSLRVKLSDL